MLFLHCVISDIASLDGRPHQGRAAGDSWPGPQSSVRRPGPRLAERDQVGRGDVRKYRDYTEAVC
jgi:hypothetical protein